jgi:hypothetical protein
MNTILFIRGFSTLNNFTIKYYFGVAIWILSDEKLSYYFKPQLKSLRGKNKYLFFVFCPLEVSH